MRTMMRVVHLIERMDPSVGGPPAVVARLGAAQSSLGHQVTIARYSPEDDAHSVAQAVRLIPGFDQVLTLDLGRRVGIERLAARHGTSVLRRHLSGSIRPDILHLHGVWDPIIFRAGRLAHAAGVKIVVAPHSLLHEWSMSQHSFRKASMWRLGSRRLVSGAAFVHCLNQDEVEQVGRLRLGAPLEVIPNGVFEEEVTPIPKPGAFRRRLMRLEGRQYVLFLSRLHYKKGLDYLADAFARVVAAGWLGDLVVAGPDGGAKAAFIQQVASLRLTDRVHVLDPIYGQAKIEAFADAACFCLPSRQEGFSMAIVEAMACGCPVVISESCYFPEVAQAGAGRVVPLHADAIASALLEVLGHGEQAVAMGRAGRELVLSRYTWPAIARRSIDLYMQHGRVAHNGSVG
jgi:glycosyltransferase involved in cell wall biosynthesis